MAITQAPPPSPAPVPPDEEQHAPGDKEMTLLEHLEELRGRLVAMMVALVVGVLISIVPIPTLNSITGFLFDLIVNNAKSSGVTIIAIRPGETFFTYLEVALVIGAALAMPVIIYQILAFVTPALYANEKRYLYLAVPGVFFSFMCGVVFCYFLTLPFATRFLAGFLAGTIEPQWTVEHYVDFVATFLFWVGVMFELPIIMFFLSKLGVVSHRRLASFRKYAFILAFVIGAAITPTPDPINQTIISLPIYFLFELGVILARFA
ncbi:MAG: twin-arginine translocase subunit TatC [Chloroflexi bacterium]|nr:twin-arginine translocase subunit TatC [Chloroflexota bacterium]MBV9896681.1 twin-arginine translocase subunit TatC [Chloroflexota bacterium]